MINHPELRVLILSAADTISFPWPGFAEGMAHLQVTNSATLPGNLDSYHTIITNGASFAPTETERLLDFARTGGAWLAMIGLQRNLLPEAFGVTTETIGPAAELRVLFQDAANPLAARLPDAIYVGGAYHPLQITAPDTQTLLYADWHYTHSSVFTTRSFKNGHLAATSLQDFSASMLRQLIYRLIRKWHGSAPAPQTSLGVGILGYAPSVGPVHGLASGQTPGLELKASCDLNAQRLSQAATDFPGITSHENATSLAEDPDVDLVIVATAPNTHAALSMEMMAAGKHVLCEKPIALNRKETDAMQEMAARQAVHLSCHQNRRWDPDYLAIKGIVERGEIGELFYMETFVGGFHHPCGYWHSHAAVSGGTSFDWGAHYLDWIISLIPAPISSVVGTRHKRVWHDVTNGDQERILIRFADGQEAEFLHSDIAAARKPKWYLLGIHGAISSSWQDITAFEADPIYYFQQTDIPATEMMPELTLHRRCSQEETESSRPVLAKRNPYAFHYNLVDHLLWGEPLAAPLADSVKVVKILEAAALSMANSGSVEVICG